MNYYNIFLRQFTTWGILSHYLTPWAIRPLPGYNYSLKTSQILKNRRGLDSSPIGVKFPPKIAPRRLYTVRKKIQNFFPETNVIIIYWGKNCGKAFLKLFLHMKLATFHPSYRWNIKRQQYGTISKNTGLKKWKLSLKFWSKCILKFLTPVSHNWCHIVVFIRDILF